jgi:hypothetical protein
VFTYPSQMTCLDAQFAANAIATVQSLRRAPSPPYAPVNVSHFGGVFFALASRSDIVTVADLAGKRLEGADITSLGAGQAQWHQLEAHDGLHFWNLPSQVLFSHDQFAVVADVAAGVADVGMVRTDYLEALQLPAPYCDAAAQAAVGLGCFPPGTFKILNPLTFPGYPFQSSTELYPEARAVAAAPARRPPQAKRAADSRATLYASAFARRSGRLLRCRTWTPRRRSAWLRRCSRWGPPARPRRSTRLRRASTHSRRHCRT